MNELLYLFLLSLNKDYNNVKLFNEYFKEYNRTEESLDTLKCFMKLINKVNLKEISHIANINIINKETENIADIVFNYSTYNEYSGLFDDYTLNFKHKILHQSHSVLINKYIKSILQQDLYLEHVLENNPNIDFLEEQKKIFLKFLIILNHISNQKDINYKRVEGIISLINVYYDSKTSYNHRKNIIFYLSYFKTNLEQKNSYFSINSSKLNLILEENFLDYQNDSGEFAKLMTTSEKFKNMVDSLRLEKISEIIKDLKINKLKVDEILFDDNIFL